MNINSISNNHLFSSKEHLNAMYQKKQNNPVNSVVQSINQKIENEASILEISNESIQKLQIRNLSKIDDAEKKISEYVKTLKEKYDTLFETDSKLDEVTELVEKYNEIMKDKGADTTHLPKPNKKDTELSESEKAITDSMNELSGMIEEVERMKAKEEGNEYTIEGSLAEKFKNFNMANIESCAGMLKDAKKLVEQEIKKLYKEIAKLMEKIGKTMASEEKEITSEKESLSNQIKFLGDVLNNA